MEPTNGGHTTKKIKNVIEAMKMVARGNKLSILVHKDNLVH
jgi:hypothetical protein